MRQEELQEIKKNPALIAKYIDHTEVSPNSTAADIKKLCAEAKKYGFYLAMVLPYYAPLAKKLLRGTKIKIGVVMGFPFGAQCTEAKLAEMKKAFPFADEFDFVINRQALKNKDYGFILKELKTLARAKRGKIMKVIIESPELTNTEIYKASQLILASGADFVKTAVGLRGGAKISDVKIMKKVVGDKIKIKASGGIKNFKTALAFLAAGASRLGTSHGVEIVKGGSSSKKSYFHE
ncbi:MAG: deoxyribose-phosphate aldolase [Patescibacteria group bacterium]|jgi:deoxyribose-phosphate aldolase